MKIIEEQLLLNNIISIKEFIDSNKTVKNIYENIEKLKNQSLQDVSLKSDLEFFDEISFILSVITSIVNHPQITTKGEDIIIRAEQAPSIQAEEYQKILQDSRLWKRKKAEMLPEYVYYYQSTDQINTYENRFIVLVINIIDQELLKYNEFYVSLIQSFNGQEKLSLDKDKQEIALKKLNLLLKKIKFIKNTYFYREVSKSKEVIKVVQPTNILLKNRLYNYCFKFYRKRIAYVDKTILENDFKTYYFTLLLKSLYKKNFAYIDINDKTLTFNENSDLEIEDLKFTSVDYTVTINKNDLGFEVIVENDRIKNSIKGKHLLAFDIENAFNGIDLHLRKSLPNKDEYHTVETLSLWKTAYVENINNERGSFELNVISDNSLNEEGLMDKWLSDKIANSFASKELYEKYCPVCRSTDKEVANNIYECMHCKSIYTFYKDSNNKQCIWFIKLRRA